MGQNVTLKSALDIQTFYLRFENTLFRPNSPRCSVEIQLASSQGPLDPYLQQVQFDAAERHFRCPIRVNKDEDRSKLGEIP